MNVHSQFNVIHFKVVYSKLIKELETLNRLNTTKQLYLVTWAHKMYMNIFVGNSSRTF